MLTPISPDTPTPLEQLLPLAAAAREAIEAEWQRQQDEREAIERAEAVQAADAFIRRVFPNTLAKVLTGPPEERWVGYRSLSALEDGTETLPCAVTHLGDSVFLRHVRAPGFGPHRPFDVLVLLFPCGCGNYIEAVVADEHDLADVLDDLDHSECAGACSPSIGFHDDEDLDDEDDGPQVEDVIGDLADYGERQRWSA